MFHKLLKASALESFLPMHCWDPELPNFYWPHALWQTLSMSYFLLQIIGFKYKVTAEKYINKKIFFIFNEKLLLVLKWGTSPEYDSPVLKSLYRNLWIYSPWKPTVFWWFRGE